MKYLFHLGHPAHFHLFKNVISDLKDKDNQVAVLIKKKDLLEELLKESKIEYYNLLPKGRKDNKLGIALGMIETDLKLLRFSLSYKPDIMIGTSYAISHVGKLLNIPSINVNEDDFDVVPLYCKLSYPWASAIITPIVCKTGKWRYKTINYSGYHELAYLHPHYFTPDKSVVSRYFDPEKPYFIIRFAKLTAYHDEGIKGIDRQKAKQIIEILKPYGDIYITSERSLEQEFEKYRMNIDPLDIHHVMAFAQLYIGDSQTMAAEAGLLGTPFVRFNDFVGRISYLAELEDNYHLGFGIPSSDENKLIPKISEMLQTPNLRAIYAERHNKMLTEKIDVTAFLVWFIENYPESFKIMKETPDYQLRFK